MVARLVCAAQPVPGALRGSQHVLWLIPPDGAGEQQCASGRAGRAKPPDFLRGKRRGSRESGKHCM